MEIALLGTMGRDEAAADRLVAEGYRLHVLGEWENPGLVDKAGMSGGQFHHVSSKKAVEEIADIVQAIGPGMFLTNFDDALAAGVIDGIQRRVQQGRMPDLLLPSPDKAAAKVEWDKFYLRELIDEIDSKYNPDHNFMVEDESLVDGAVNYLESIGKPVVIKPRYLTGGKGVKVQGKHFESYEDAKAYAREVLADSTQGACEIQEVVEGHEFTLQLFTDGETLVEPPATYDYPYREDGDTGPGTGGMGTFTMRDGEMLPFVTRADYDEAVGLMKQLTLKMKEKGLDYKGVLYPTFFKSPNGLKIVEVNARGGDPELINIIDLIDDDTNYGEVLQQIGGKELTPQSVRFKQLASAMAYLVAPEYGYQQDPGAYHEFELDPALVAAEGCRIRFAAAVRIGEKRFRTNSLSRIVGLSALDETPWAARARIHAAINNGIQGPLQYRRDIASRGYLKNLAA